MTGQCGTCDTHVVMSSETRSLPGLPNKPIAEPDTPRADTEAVTPTSVVAPSTPVSTSVAAPPAPMARNQPWPRLSVRRVARWALVTIALFVIGWLFWRAWSVLLPFQIGLVMAYLVLPLVNWLERFTPRWSAILTVYLGGLMLLVGFFAYIVPPLANQITNFINEFPTLHDINNLFNQLFEQYHSTVATIPEAVQQPVHEAVDQSIDSLQRNLTTYVEGVGTFLITSVLQVVNTVTFVLGFVIVPFWLFYVLKDQRAGFNFINKLMPEQMCADFWAALTIVDRVFSNYVRGQLFLGVVVGSMAGLGLSILGMFGLNVDFVLILAIIAGITELIPIIGPVIGAIPAIVLGFFDSPTTGLAVILLYIAIQQLENHLLVPRIVGDSVGIHPAILMVLLVMIGHTFGLIGIILSAPLSAVLRDLFVYTHGRLSDPPRPAGILPKRLQ